MKQIVSLLTVLVLIFSTVQISKASPLIFKATKEGVKGEYAKLGGFSSGKYKELRIAVASKDQTPPTRILIQGVEDGSAFAIDDAEFTGSYSQVVKIPPSNINVYVVGEGSFRLFVWAE